MELRHVVSKLDDACAESAGAPAIMFGNTHAHTSGVALLVPETRIWRPWYEVFCRVISDGMAEGIHGGNSVASLGSSSGPQHLQT